MKKQHLFAFGLALSINAQGASIHSGLLNYWSLDETGADTASSFAESTGVTDNTGTANGNAFFAGGLFGSAISLDGSAGTYVSVPDGGPAGANANDIDRSGSDLSISMWVNVTTFDKGWQGVISHGEQNDYRIGRNSRRNTDQNVVNYAGGTGDISTTTNVNDQSWHHLAAITLDGVGTQFFIDGNLEGESLNANTSINSSNASNYILWIGGNPDNGREFNGMIDDVAMWDRGLTSDEVLEIYSQGISGNSLGAIGAIPEPSSALLMLSGIFAGIFRRNR